MRCKACNRILEQRDIFINPKTDMMEELCGGCRGVAFAASHYLDGCLNDSVENLGELAAELDRQKEQWD